MLSVKVAVFLCIAAIFLILKIGVYNKLYLHEYQNLLVVSNSVDDRCPLVLHKNEISGLTYTLLLEK